ncbi:hypothetical protein DFH28DRAFT_1140412 [Melampsora americana]|nr:hypothetical protein DFH28DRAFT_1140412 [Melampsora americana]
MDPPQTTLNTPPRNPASADTKVILPAPPEIEIVSQDGKRDALDEYVQAFGAYKHGYNIRKGNSRLASSAIIIAIEEMTARINRQNNSWNLIHIHLEHNHPPDYTVKPRKRKPKPISTLGCDTTTLEPHPASPQQPDTTQGITNDTSQAPSSRELASYKSGQLDNSLQEQNNTSFERMLDEISASLKGMSPTTRQQKINQIKCIINKRSSAPVPNSVIPAIPPNVHVNPPLVVEEELAQEKKSINQMIEDFLRPFPDHDSLENSHTQVAIDLNPVAGSPLPQQINSQPRSPECLKTEAQSPNDIDNGSTYPQPTNNVEVVNPNLSGKLEPKKTSRSPIPIARWVTRHQACQCALLLKPPPNPALPALLAKYKIKSWLAPFVSDIHEVKEDGHCGFRAIAVSLGCPQYDWPFIRQSLQETLEQHPDTFTEKQLPGTRSQALSRLRTTKPIVVMEREHWLMMPGFGELIATTFDRPVIYYDPTASSLFTLPYLSPPNKNPPIVLAFHNLHFCSLTLDYTLPGLPIPRLDPIWRRFHSPDTSPWRKQAAPITID